LIPSTFSFLSFSLLSLNFILEWSGISIYVESYPFVVTSKNNKDLLFDMEDCLFRMSQPHHTWNFDAIFVTRSTWNKSSKHATNETNTQKHFHNFILHITLISCIIIPKDRICFPMSSCIWSAATSIYSSPCLCLYCMAKA